MQISIQAVAVLLPISGNVGTTRGSTTIVRDTRGPSMIVRDTQPSMIVRDNQRTRRKVFEEFSTEEDLLNSTS